jgi:hypothetical protein
VTLAPGLIAYTRIATTRVDDHAVLVLHPISKDTPATLSRTVDLPASPPQQLTIKVGPEGGPEGDFVLSALANGVLLSQPVTVAKEAAPYRTLSFDLSALRGKKADLRLDFASGGKRSWHLESARCVWIRIEPSTSKAPTAAASKLEQELHAIIARRNEATAEATTPLISRYKEGLENVLKQATQAGDLDAAVRIREAIKGNLPRSSAESPFNRNMATLALQRDKAISVAISPINKRFNAETEALLKRATQANDLDAALKIRHAMAGNPTIAAAAPGLVELTKRGLEKKLVGMTFATETNDWLQRVTFAKDCVVIHNPDEKGKGRAATFKAVDGQTITYPWDGITMTIGFAPDLGSCVRGQVTYKRR